MAVPRTKGGCGCAVAVLVAVLGAAGFAVYKFGLPWWNKHSQQPSGAEMRVVVLDVGQGDSVLVISPGGQVLLVDAGDEKNGKTVVEALRRNNVKQIDYFMATHTHPDHIGGAAEVFENFDVKKVLWNDFPPPEAQPSPTPTPAAGKGKGKSQPKPPPAPRGKPVKFPTVEAYEDFKAAVEEEKAELITAAPDQRIDLGGGADITILAPVPPPFTREQINNARSGNESNANSVVARLHYGDFYMLLTGDAEASTEERMLGRESEVTASVLKVAHHGSKYATTENFLKRVFPADAQQPKTAVISMSEFNRYGHPSQETLGRLKAAGVTGIYRTDLNGEITITTTGKVKDGKLYEVKAARESKADPWAGREGTKDDSSRSGFIAYGDYEPARRRKK